jgi:hypothetical protein
MTAGKHMSVRANHLLTAMRQTPLKSWTTGEVHGLYRALGLSPQRSTARRDLQHLASRGRLVATGPENGRVYRLAGARCR